MNANATLVLGALTDEPQTRQRIAELTGLELALVSTTLSALKSKGEAFNTPQGWVTGSEATERKTQETEKMDIPTLRVEPSSKGGRGCENGAKKAPKGETVPPRFYRGEQGDLIIDTGRPGAGSKRMVIDAEDVERLRRFIAK